MLTNNRAGFGFTSWRKLDSLVAHCPLTAKNFYFCVFPWLILTALTGWQESWPRQFTSAYVPGRTGGWSDAQLLCTTVEDRYLSDWADVRYLAGLPSRFPYRMSPDGLPLFTRDKSSLPVPESVSDTFPLLSVFSWLVPLLIAHIVKWWRQSGGQDTDH